MPEKITYALLCYIFIPLFIHAAQITETLQYLHFSHSKQKKEGLRSSLYFIHTKNRNRYEFLWEKSDTRTFQPPLPNNLHVDKYFLTYSRSIIPKQSLQLHLATINDNLSKETDNGKLYGIGYRYKHFMITQYYSNYHNFNVYQTDLLYKNKKAFTSGTLGYIWIVKYIHIHEQTPNPFTKYAKNNYVTPGFKLHFQQKRFYLETGAFFSKRLFAIMNNGFAMQHHAMEFHQHYIFALGSQTTNWHFKLGYTYLKADEIPLQNNNVTVESVMLSASYKF